MINARFKLPQSQIRELVSLLTVPWGQVGRPQAIPQGEVNVPRTGEDEVGLLLGQLAEQLRLGHGRVAAIAREIMAPICSTRLIYTIECHATRAGLPEEAVWLIACRCIERRHGFQLVPGMQGVLRRATEDVKWGRDEMPDLPELVTSRDGDREYWCAASGVSLGDGWDLLGAARAQLMQADSALKAAETALGEVDSMLLTVLHERVLFEFLRQAVSLTENGVDDYIDKNEAITGLRERVSELRDDRRWKLLRELAGQLKIARERRGRGKRPGWQGDAAAWAWGLWRALGRRPTYRKDQQTPGEGPMTEFHRFAFRWFRLLGIEEPMNALRDPPTEPRCNPYRPGRFAKICTPLACPSDDPTRVDDEKPAPDAS